MPRNLFQGVRYADADQRPHPIAAAYMARKREHVFEQACLMPGSWVLDYSLSGSFVFRVGRTVSC